MGKFDHLKSRDPRPVTPTPPTAPEIRNDEPAPVTAPSSNAASATTRAPARDGKKQIAGYFSEEGVRQFRVLAAELGVTHQALLGEALDDVMRKHGKHPLGER